MEQLHTLSLLAKNHPGVLSRITGLFSRRGFNIESLTASIARGPETSRITLVVSGDEYALEQIGKQLAKLEDVIKVVEFDPARTVARELALIKIEAAPADRGIILETADIFRAKVVDVSQSTVTAEITGNSEKIDAFLNLLEPHAVKEMVRTGITALERGGGDIRDHEEE